MTPDLAAIGSKFTGGDLEQGGLAGAVTADQAYPFASVDLETSIVEQPVETESDGNVFEGEQGHGGRRVWDGRL
jgi:hypothetical protein